jgi:cell wall assembly regulator SMI1
VLADSCPFNNAAQLEEYFTQVEAFSKDFELEFMVDDDWTAVLEKKRKQLNVLRELERFSKGDPDIQAAFIGWPMCEILVSNPFRGNDMRRVEFDSHCMLPPAVQWSCVNHALQCAIAMPLSLVTGNCTMFHQH